MALTHATTTRNSLAQKIQQLVDGGGGQGKLLIRAGTGTLATLLMNATSFGAAVSGTITANTIAQVTAAAPGVADNFQLTDSTGTLILSGTVTATGGGGDLTITNTNIAAGDPISVTSFTYTAST